MVCLRQLLVSFSTGDQFVAVRCLYSNEVNNVKDSFLPCEASALFQQVVLSQVRPEPSLCEYESAEIPSLTQAQIVIVLLKSGLVQFSSKNFKLRT